MDTYVRFPKHTTGDVPKNSGGGLGDAAHTFQRPLEEFTGIQDVLDRVHAEGIRPAHILGMCVQGHQRPDRESLISNPLCVGSLVEFASNPLDGELFGQQKSRTKQERKE